MEFTAKRSDMQMTFLESVDLHDSIVEISEKPMYAPVAYCYMHG